MTHEPAPLAIVSAMHEELRALLPHLERSQRVVRGGREFHLGRLHGCRVVLVQSGIGKVAAATTAAVLAIEFKPCALLFTGVAGGLADGVRVGDLVLATELLQHDMDASPLFPRFEVPLTGRSRFPVDAGLGAILGEAAAQCLAGAPISARHLAEFDIEQPRLHRGLVVSGDRFLATSAESAALRSALPDALAVEMEGAAVAQVCADFGLPLAVLRVVSDRADDAAHVDFVRFTREVAAEFTRVILAAVLTRLAKR